MNEWVPFPRFGTSENTLNIIYFIYIKNTVMNGPIMQINIPHIENHIPLISELKVVMRIVKPDTTYEHDLNQSQYCEQCLIESIKKTIVKISVN